MASGATALPPDRAQPAADALSNVAMTNRHSEPALRLRWLLTLDRMLASIETIVATLIFIMMLSFMVVQVSARYFLEIPLPWSEELIRYLFVATSFIGAAAVCKYNEHIEINLIDSFVDKVKSEKRKAMVVRWQRMAADIFSLITLLVFAWYSYGFVMRLMESDQRSPAMDFPTYIVAGVMLLGVWLMIAHYIVKLLDNTLNGTRQNSAGLQ